MQYDGDTTDIPLHDNTEPGKQAPETHLLKLTDRFEEAMMLNRNLWHAFRAWHSALDAWALKDPIFMKEAREHHKRVAEAQRKRGPVPFIDYVAGIRTSYYDVMRRMGIFDGTGASARKSFDTETDLGRN